LSLVDTPDPAQSPSTSAPARDGEGEVGQRTELKLRTDEAGLMRLRRSTFWKALGNSRPKAVQSTYFDTSEHTLRDAGLSVRVRKIGRGYEQRIESKAKGGHSTVASTVRLRGPQPDLTLVSDPIVLSELHRALRSPLRPVFASRVQRTLRRACDEHGHEVEITLDRGTIAGGDTELPVYEVRLELASGSAESMFGIAERLVGDVPMVVQTRSDVSRGYELVAGDAATWFKYEKLHLSPSHTAEEALDRVVANCVAHASRNSECAATRAHIEGVHQVRVAFRRLRSALSVFSPLLPSEQVTHFRAECAWASSALGAARDWDVFATELVPELDGRLSASALSRLEGLVEDQRVEAYDAVVQALSSPRFATLLVQLSRWRGERGWRKQQLTEEGSLLFAPVTEIAGSVLQKRDRRVRRRGKKLAHLDVPQRHELRIALKKLRYSTDFFRSLYARGAVRPFLKRMAELQDLFGHLNDVAQIDHYSALLAKSCPSPEITQALAFLSGWHSRGVSEMEDDLLRAWKCFERTPRFWR